jgi:hypothetical protein
VFGYSCCYRIAFYEMSKPVIKAPTHGYAFVGALCLVIRVVTALPFEMSKPVIKAPTHGYSLNPKPYTLNPKPQTLNPKP